MSIDSTADWEGLRHAAAVARLTLDTLAAQLRPGLTTGELDAATVEIALLKERHKRLIATIPTE